MTNYTGEPVETTLSRTSNSTANGPFYKNPWFWGTAILCLLLGFAGGFGSGRYALPAQTIVTERVKEVEKQVVVTQTETKVKTEVKVVYVKDKSVQKDEHKVVTVIEDPNGKKTTTIVSDDRSKIDTQVKTGTDATSDVASNTSKKEVDQKTSESEKKAVTKNQVGWTVRAGVGVSIPTLLGEKAVGVPGLRGFVVEAGVSRKVIGPFYMGLFGNTQGTLGLDLSGQF